ncbi:MAG: hypothetical protein U0Y08_01640 [Bacteroidia bacterium]
MKPLLPAIAMVCLITTASSAQQTFSERSCRKNPHWISMMDDTLSNYNDVVRAFDLYWEEHEMPKEEDEILGMKNAEEHEKRDPSRWLKRLFGTSGNKDETELAFAVKRYRHWKLMTEPWVQEDGTIYTPYQRRQILESIQR